MRKDPAAGTSRLGGQTWALPDATHNAHQKLPRLPLPPCFLVVYRCAGGGGQLPQPSLVLESEGPLQYDEADWEQGWVSQGGEQVYSVRMRVSGHPG